jgi:hypothetical protein
VTGRQPRRVDWAAFNYLPSGAPLLRCARRGCGAAYTDDEPGRQAHIAVFGHSPRTRDDQPEPMEEPR